jgi:DNA-binding protein Fis
MKRKIRVLAIAPYEALKDTMIRIANERSDIELTIRVGVINEGADIVKEYNQGDFDAILSRGGTKLEIDKIATIPVFETPISYFDLLNIVKLVEHYNGKIAILAYANIAKSARLLCEIFHYDYHISVIDIWHNAKEKVLRLKDEGYSLIIGDAVSVKWADYYGLQSILLTSGSDSVKQVFDEIVGICTYYGELRSNALILETYLKTRNEHVMVLNQKGDLVFHNLPSAIHAVHQYCKSMIPPIQAGSEASGHKKINQKIYDVTGNKYRLNGRTFYFFGITQTAMISPFLGKSTSISLFNKENFIKGGAFFSHILQSSSSEFWNRSLRLAASNESILISGESGTEKDKLAIQLYLHSSLADHSLYIINCRRLPASELDEFFTNEHSPFHAPQSTLFFKNIEALPPALFDYCIEGLQNLPYSFSSRLLITFETNGEKENTALKNQLLHSLDCQNIELWPLRNQIDNILNFAVIHIQEYNKRHDTHIVGLEPEAIELLQSYSWPGNSGQLRRVLNEAFLSTTMPWVSAKTIRQILLREKSKNWEQRNEASTLNLNQKLDDIIHDIVMKVLSEENMNQSKTAERLGISRTTLWRLLKKAK